MMLMMLMMLTRMPGEPLSRCHAHGRPAGMSDAEVFDTNQVVSYFAYVNRMVHGLGVELEEEP